MTSQVKEGAAWKVPGQLAHAFGVMVAEKSNNNLQMILVPRRDQSFDCRIAH